MNRRHFFQAVAGFTGLALLKPKSLKEIFPSAHAQEKRRGAPGGAAPAAGGKDTDLPLVEPGKDLAATVNYFHKASEVKDAKLKTDRQGVPFAKQDCAGCSFYASVGKKGSDEVGKCTIFAGKLVKGTGWCSSWNKKA
ncbi:MAG: high-potential iron-sulfur protein [Bdellovibrionales bacterium]|nr:high-potential iron-sulfur protein [Bdellovibrionales bacterium]